ncbi:hypothetical protein [Streptomyces albipurpureus]|uniref:Uncharacterized protein n=1 Tax=Streptomyces albipurpureus TaxID=2897419 RepID=A0ABT0UNH3_9ACTN|nr:hypothetical protein [Streptomyces sp. CWNU-1]MCM2389881.1 hypothetical protein [Streptomyces sp. CWNU-1]
MTTDGYAFHQAFRGERLDRATFRGDTVSTHLVAVEGGSRLRCWGPPGQMEPPYALP